MNKRFIFNYKNIKNNEAGFSLPEVLIALVIICVGMLAIASVQTSSTGGNTNARMVSKASTYAVDQMERLLNLDYGNAALASGTTGNRTEGPYTITWSITNNPGTANTRFITVSVTSSNRYRAIRQVTLTSLKSDSM